MDLFFYFISTSFYNARKKKIAKKYGNLCFHKFPYPAQEFFQLFRYCRFTHSEFVCNLLHSAFLKKVAPNQKEIFKLKVGNDFLQFFKTKVFKSRFKGRIADSRNLSSLQHCFGISLTRVPAVAPPFSRLPFSVGF